MEEGFKANIEATGIAAQITRFKGMMCQFFTDTPIVDFASVMTSDTEKYARYFRAMLEAGNLLAPSQLLDGSGFHGIIHLGMGL